MQLDVIKMDEISQEYALFSHKNYAKLIKHAVRLSINMYS